MIAETEVERRVRELYEALDLAVARVQTGKPISCSRGCFGCCYQLVGIGIGEALHIAADLARRADVRPIARKLATAAEEQVAPGANKRTHFDRAIPCVFLRAVDGETVGNRRAHECSIYERRPAACRYHFVRSPPDNCYPGAVDGHTERYDADQTATHLVALDRALFEENPALGEPTMGTLPHLVLYALRFAVGGADRRFIEKQLAKLPTPQDWTREHLRGTHGASMIVPDAGDAVEMGARKMLVNLRGMSK